MTEVKIDVDKVQKVQWFAPNSNALDATILQLELLPLLDAKTLTRFEQCSHFTQTQANNKRLWAALVSDRFSLNAAIAAALNDPKKDFEERHGRAIQAQRDAIVRQLREEAEERREKWGTCCTILCGDAVPCIIVTLFTVFLGLFTVCSHGMLVLADSESITDCNCERQAVGVIWLVAVIADGYLRCWICVCLWFGSTVPEIARAFTVRATRGFLREHVLVQNRKW